MLSVARRLLCAAHRGSQSSRTPKPRGSHSQHAARTRPAVSGIGIGERRGRSRLLVETPRRAATWPRVDVRAGARDS